MAEGLPSTSDPSVGLVPAPSVPANPSAPPVDDSHSAQYPVLAQPGQQKYAQFQPQQPQQQQYAIPQQPQQPQQVVYKQSDESKQSDTNISNTFDTLIQTLSNKKAAILNQCLSANNLQKQDILKQLQPVMNSINTIQLNPNLIPQPQQVVLAQPQPQQNIKYISDTLNSAVTHHHLVFNPQTNSVYRKGKKGEWLNCYGNQIISKGLYKKWNVKIIPRFVPTHPKQHVADVVIGVVGSDTMSDRAGGFWMPPMLGYGYYGYSGKKFHSNRKGKNYADKFKINDIISVEINMKEYVLDFYVNGEHKGRAFSIDGRHSYVLALALCNDNYDLQIC